MQCSEAMLCPIKAVEAAFAEVKPDVCFLYLNLLPTPCVVIDVPGGNTHLVHLMHAPLDPCEISRLLLRFMHLVLSFVIL